MRFVSLLILALGATFCYAEPPKVSVSGPSSVEPGQLIVLTAIGEGASNYLWIPDADLGQVLQCNPQTIGMASPRIGVHKVILVASSDKGEMSFVTHVLKIAKPDVPEDPKPDPKPDDPKPDPPAPGPGVDYTNIHKISMEGAAKVNDPQTAQQIQLNLNRVLPDLAKAATVDEAKIQVTKTIEAVLLFRGNKKTEWAENWRKPIFYEISKYTFKSPLEYSNAVKAFASGLTNSPLCIDCK